LLRAFLNGRKTETITAYRQDLEDFQAFIQAPSLEQAASLLLALGLREAKHWRRVVPLSSDMPGSRAVFGLSGRNFHRKDVT
jgi:hypothetical protein